MLVLLPFVFVALASSHEIRDIGLCSQIYQMHEYCTGFSNTTVARGPPGPPGPPGVVDYAAIKAVIDARFAALQTQLQNRVKQFEQKAEMLLKEIAAKANVNYLCDQLTEKTAQIWNGTGGVFDLQFGGNDLKAYCDLTTENGSWLVFQRRMDGSVDFYRNWADFVNGFGDPAGEHWLGLETIHQLTTEKPHELRVELEDWEGNKRFAKYSTFRIGDADSEYRLEIGGYSGNAGESIIDFSNGRRFTTIDNDNDGYRGGNCAVLYKGAWWHNFCHESNLNGKYLRGSHSSYADGVEWEAWRGYYYSLKFTEMKIRPIGLREGSGA